MARASKTPEQFAAELAAVAPTVETLDAYVNARTKVRCRCRVCGHEWEPLPRGLLQGNGCPACARRRTSGNLRGGVGEHGRA